MAENDVIRIVSFNSSGSTCELYFKNSDIKYKWNISTWTEMNASYFLFLSQDCKWWHKNGYNYESSTENGVC